MGRDVGKGAALGVDFGGTRIKLGLVDETGRVLARGLRPTPREGGRDSILAAIAGAANDLVAASGGSVRDLRGIGLGTPGPLDLARERVLLAPNIPGWEDLPLRRLLEERLGRPVELENDANAAALGEFWAGAGRGARTIIFLGLGTGVGGGIILDGRLWRGAHGAGAELGHVTVDPEGPPCGCGSRGCVETMSAAPAILRSARRALDEGRAPRLAELLRAGADGAELTPELVARAAEDGDEGARETYRDVGRWLGVAVAGFMNVLDPDKVVIGGGIAGSIGLILPALTEEIHLRSFEVIYRHVDVVPAALGDDAGVVGAAAPFFLEGR